MAVFRTRIDSSRLLLRVAIGGMAMLLGFEAVKHAGVPHTLVAAGYWLVHLTEMSCGLLLLIGFWMPIASVVLTLSVDWSLVDGWIHGASLLGNLQGLFLLLVTLATALGGAGKWAVGRD